MSLRVRLVLLIVALVGLVAMALSVLYLDNLINTLSTDALERSDQASQQVKAFVIGQINQHAPEYEVPSSLEETKTLWNEVVAADPDLPTMLEKMLALSPSLLEINIAGQTGRILASSNPLRIDGTLCARSIFSRGGRTARSTGAWWI